MKNDFTSIIEQAGLTKPQARVYAALLEIEEGTMTDVAKAAEVERPSAYNAMEKLEQIGLASKIRRGKRNYYSGVHPRRLLQIAEFKRNQIEEHLPKLVGAYQGEGEKPKIQMFEGMKAARDVYREAFERLRAGEELLIFSNIGQAEKLFPVLVSEFKRTVGAVIYRSKAREITYGDSAGKKFASSLRGKVGKGYELRLSDSALPFGNNEQFIFEDKIIYFALQKHIFVVVIENKDLALTHKAMFEMAWEQAEVVG